MHCFQLTVFLLSAVALPVLAIVLMFARLSGLVKGVLFAVLAVAARYLLFAVWTPDSTSALWLKGIVCTTALYLVWVKIGDIYLKSTRPWVSFVSFMSLPILVAFVFLGSFPSLVTGGNSLVFWTGWIAWGLVRTALLAKRTTRLGRVILAVVGIALLTFSLVGDVRAKVSGYVGRLNDYLRQNVVERWEPIRQGTERIVAAWDALVEMDRRATAEGKVGKGKLVASIEIRNLVSDLCKELLTTDSRAVLERVKKLDGRIAEARKDLSELREKSGLDPLKFEQMKGRIGEAEASLASLVSARAEAMALAREELKEIGLTLPDNSPFLTVDLGALVDNAIVTRNIGFVVENLREVVDAEKGNAEAAKRYYGAYIVMLDVQMTCFRQYLDKAATGIWRDGISDVAKNAEAAKRGNEIKAAESGRTEEERKAFLHAAATNERTLKAARAYLAILARHEEVVREKLAATERRHGIALSFRESVDIASSFGASVLSDTADFSALLELKLPEIAFFDDEAMQSEFDAITTKLMGE